MLQMIKEGMLSFGAKKLRIPAESGPKSKFRWLPETDSPSVIKGSAACKTAVAPAAEFSESVTDPSDKLKSKLSMSARLSSPVFPSVVSVPETVIPPK